MEFQFNPSYITDNEMEISREKILKQMADEQANAQKREKQRAYYYEHKEHLKAIRKKKEINGGYNSTDRHRERMENEPGFTERFHQQCKARYEKSVESGVMAANYKIIVEKKKAKEETMTAEERQVLRLETNKKARGRYLTGKRYLESKKYLTSQKKMADAENLKKEVEKEAVLVSLYRGEKDETGIWIFG